MSSSTKLFPVFFVCSVCSWFAFGERDDELRKAPKNIDKATKLKIGESLTVQTEHGNYIVVDVKQTGDEVGVAKGAEPKMSMNLESKSTSIRIYSVRNGQELTTFDSDGDGIPEKRLTKGEERAVLELVETEFVEAKPE